ncbi:uncharacterized protein At4g17910-like isoform X2 [Apium graveolens]|uniref:uncharacterized protein At4g17910-like isoform X2 n=1 Tax=Apium graveolens TaxID=4045 RepID=UPI003D7BA623
MIPILTDWIKTIQMNVGMDSSFINTDRQLKEQFVSNLNGCSMLEVFLLTSLFSVTLLIRRLFDQDFNCAAFKKDDDVFATRKNWSEVLMTTALDFLFIALPTILFLTVLADWIYKVAIFLLVVLILCVTYKRYAFVSLEGIQTLQPYISAYRVAVMLGTCICILAVDFKIFPRRYAKTETYGTSVMDLGVGSFVLANSLVSRQARGTLRTSLKKAISSTTPLIFLGFARLVSTTGVNYQVHVGEYGQHWNFFFTLAAISILTAIVNVPAMYCGILGSLILIGYQICLVKGLNIYLLSEERGTDIISRNKEGIYSIFGYWGMYLVGVQLGSYLFFGNHIHEVRLNNSAEIRASILALVFWILTLFLEEHVERPSRRMCNLAYVTNVMAVNLQMLAIVMLGEHIPGPKISTLEKAFNNNLLGSFLLL